MAIPFVDGQSHANSKHGRPFSHENGFADDPARVWAASHERLDPEFKAIIWFDFSPRSYSPAKASFKIVQQQIPTEHRPKEHVSRQWTPIKWQFVGSNDDPCKSKGDWTVICQKAKNRGSTSSSDVLRECQADTEDGQMPFKPFRCLGIRIMETEDPEGRHAALYGIRMWAWHEEGEEFSEGSKADSLRGG